MRELRHDETVVKNKHIGQTLHGDGIYVTIHWTSDGCDVQVDFNFTSVAPGVRSSDKWYYFLI